MCKHCALGLFLTLNILGVLVSFAMVNIGAIALLSSEVVRTITLPYIEKWGFGPVAVNQTQLANVADEFHKMIAPLGLAPIIFGCFIFVTSVIGLIGSCYSKQAVLITYSVFCALLIVVPIILIAVYFSHQEQMLASAYTFLETNMKKYTNLKSGDTITILMAGIMSGYKCCGYTNGSDFTQLGWPKPDYVYDQAITVPYPIPCCKPPGGGWAPSGSTGTVTPLPGSSTCPPNYDATNSYITLGCKESLGQTLMAMTNLIVLASIGPLFCTGLAFSLAVILIDKRMKE